MASLNLPEFPRIASARARTAYIAAPLVTFVVAAALLGHPATRVQARPWLLFENSPVELLTFAFFALGGATGLALAARAQRAGLGAFTVGFFAVYSLGLLLVAGEEIAWGQWFFHWATPAAWSAVNVQHETTLHNVPGLDENLPMLHTLFGVGALVGVKTARIRPLAWVSTPPVLAPWFAIVAIHAACELVTGALARNSIPHKLFERTSEAMEMYLAIAAWLYVSLNAKRLAQWTSAQRAATALPISAEPTRPPASPGRTG